jgi:hypothetical protein
MGTRAAYVVALGVLLAPLLVLPAEADGGRRGPGWGHGPRGGWSHRWDHRGRGWGHGPRHHGGAGFVFGLGIGALLTAPWWAAPPVYAAPTYLYPAPVYVPPPAYGVPAPAYPAGAYPALPAPSGPPPSAPSPLTPTPEPLSPPPAGSGPSAPPSLVPGSSESPPGGQAAAAAVCETVTVEGHWEARVYPDGRRLTVWVPTRTQSTCR